MVKRRTKIKRGARDENVGQGKTCDRTRNIIIMNIRNIAIIAHVDPSTTLVVPEAYSFASRCRVYGASIMYIKYYA